MTASAIRQAIEHLTPLEREQAADWRLFGPEEFARRHGFDLGEVRDALAEMSVKGGSAASTVDRSKHCWLNFVASRSDLSAAELRTAIALWRFTNTETELAWPSQTSLMQATGSSDERKVRSAVAGLEAKGLLSRVRIADLDAVQRDQIKRHGRGTCYVLRFPEAATPVARTEPRSLRQGRESKQKLKGSENG